MPEIGSLTAQVQQLGDKVDWWGNAVNVMLASTALVAFLLFLTTVRQTRLSKQLQVAQQSLSDAKDRQLASDLKQKDLEIGLANAAAANANSEAANLLKLAEDERLARAKIEARIGPRTITPEQSAFIVGQLSRFKGRKVHIHIAVGNSNDWELGHFLPQLDDVFKKAGITPDNSAIDVGRGGSVRGIAVGISEKNNEFSTAVIRALTGAGIPSLVVGTGTSDLPENEVEILVGPKQ